MIILPCSVQFDTFQLSLSCYSSSSWSVQHEGNLAKIIWRSKKTNLFTCFSLFSILSYCGSSYKNIHIDCFALTDVHTQWRWWRNHPHVHPVWPQPHHHRMMLPQEHRQLSVSPRHQGWLKNDSNPISKCKSKIANFGTKVCQGCFQTIPKMDTFANSSSYIFLFRIVDPIRILR